MALTLFAAFALAATPVAAGPSDALAVSLAACEAWISDPGSRRNAAAFPRTSGLDSSGLVAAEPVPEAASVPDVITRRRRLYTFKIPFSGGDVWVAVSDSVTACHAAVLMPTFIGPQLEYYLAAEPFVDRWSAYRDEPMGAVRQRTFGRIGMPGIFMVLTARTSPGPEGSVAQLIYTMSTYDADQ